MKGIILVSLVLLLMFVATICGVWYIEDSAQNIITDLNRLNTNISAKNWQQAELLFQQAEASWQQIQPIWQVMIDHEDMRDIEIAFVDLSVALEQKDVTEAQRELAELKFFIKHVPETERIVAQNVF